MAQSPHQHETSPADQHLPQDDHEARFNELLARYDEALANGDETQFRSDTPPLLKSVAADAELLRRLERVQGCLQLLEADRRRAAVVARSFHDRDLPTPSVSEGERFTRLTEETQSLADESDVVVNEAGLTIDDSRLAERSPSLTLRVRKSDSELESESWHDAATGRNASATMRQIGRFRIVRKIGAGGFGVVFLAEDPVLKRPVALKIPRPEALVSGDLRRRFIQEAQVAAKLDHPHIVPVHEAGEAGGCLYLVSAYCPGHNLRDWLNAAEAKEAERTLTDRQAAAIVECLARALAYCHDQGVLHRDLKPANVMLVDQPCGELPFTPKLTDFGLAKLLDLDLSASGSGAMIGTPQYMAPEQVRSDKAAIGPATDVYSLGAMLYELLTGRPPFQGSGFADILDQLRHTDPPPPSRLRPGLSRDFDTICLTCLHKEPSRRYATAQALANDLNRLLQNEPLVARPITANESRSVARRVRWLAGTALTTVVAAVWSAISSNQLAKQESAEVTSKSPSTAATASSREPDEQGMSFTHGGNVVTAPVTYDGSHPLTIEAWVNVQPPGGTLISLGGLINVSLEEHGKGSRAKVVAIVSESDNVIQHSHRTVSSNIWHHVAVTYDQQRFQMFIDGRPEPTDFYWNDGQMTVELAEPKPIELKSIWPNIALTIGSNDLGSNAWKRYPFSGRIRAVRISHTVRYRDTFQPAVDLIADTDTDALYRFSDLATDSIADETQHHGSARVVTQP